MSERKLKTIIAQMPASALPEIGEAIGAIGNVAKGVVNKSQEVGGENFRGDKEQDGDDYLNDLNIAQQSGREQFEGFGLSSDDYTQYTNDLMKLGMPSFMSPAKFLQELASIASSALTTVQQIFPVAKAIYQRNINSPERALSILRVIAKYESKAPGLGLFNLAAQAATGQYNPHTLSMIRFSLMGAPDSKGDMNETRDLQQAFDGINAPNSPLGEQLNETNLTHQRMQAVQEELLMQAAMTKLQIQKARDKKLTEIYSYLNTNLPSWIKNNTAGIKTIMNLLSGVTMANAIKDTASHGLGIGGKTGLGNLAQPHHPPLGFVGAQTNERTVVAQGVAGSAPVDMSATPNPTPATPNTATPAQGTTQTPSLTQDQQINNNMQQANKGVANDSVTQGLQMGLWDTATANEVYTLQYNISLTKSALEINYKNLTDMISAGLQPNSQFAEGFTNAAYVTPEEIQTYSQTASKNAQTLIQLIQSLLTIFATVANSSSSNQIGVQASAFMRNLEAKWRQELKEAQQIRIKIFDISVLGPIDQQVRLLEPTYTKLKSGMDMAAAFNNVGADVFVMPFSRVAQQMSELYAKAAQMYRSAIPKIQQVEPAMAQYCKVRADQMEAAAQKAMTESVVAVRNLMKQQSGGTMANNKNKFIRIAEETSSENDEKNVVNNDGAKEVEAKPLPVDEYWDELYEGEPPYGDVMVHPEKHRNEPSWKMKPKHIIKRLN